FRSYALYGSVYERCRFRKRKEHGLTIIKRYAIRCCKPVQQQNSDIQAHLLTGECIEQRLEQTGKTRWLQSQEVLSERRQERIFLRQRIKFCDIDLEAKHVLKRFSDPCRSLFNRGRTPHVDEQFRVVSCLPLRNA